MGHKAGMDSLRVVVSFCDRIGVKHLTVYAFSTENWKRPQEEVGMLMSLIREYIYKELAALHRQKVRINILGDMSRLPEDIQQKVDQAAHKTKDNRGLHLNIALNYGGRAEIVRAARRLGEEVREGRMKWEDVDEPTFQGYLYTAGTPDPELVIRTSGEVRLSNFLLWQVAYSEIVVSERWWPDFREDDLLEAIAVYQGRKRRFGGV